MAHAQSQDEVRHHYPTLRASEIGFRHFTGRRYVTVVPVRVQSDPRSDSRILADIPRLHVVYAERVPGSPWLSVRGAGTTPFPDVDEATAFVDFTDGHLVLPELEDSGSYASLVGYIPRSAVVDLDLEIEHPPLGAGLQPVPPLWEKMGLPEPRRFATRLDKPPFDAIGRLSSRSGYCTAFFIERDVVVTAGHCIPPTKPYNLTVTVDRGKSDTGERHRDVVAGTLIDARRLTDSRALGDDWAVINLRRAPRLPITPLHFHRGDAFAGRAEVEVAVVGFPADLRAVSNKVLGFNAPVMSSCVAELPEARAIVSGDNERMALRLHAPCITFPGESGGPLLIWSAVRHRYEVTGITSTYRDHDSVTPVFSLSTSATVRSYASGLATEYGVPPVEGGFGFSATLREDTPGAALLSSMLPTFGSEQPWATFPLSTSLALAIGRATGHVPKMPIAELMRPDAPVRHSGAEAAKPLTPRELAVARALCAIRCTRPALDSSHQDRATIGLLLGPAAHGGVDLSTSGGLRWHVLGGDLFGLDPSTGIARTVVRNAMNLIDGGAVAAWDSRMTCRCDKQIPLSGADIAQGAAPASLPGAKILAAREVALMTDGVQPGPVVLAADGAALAVPGSLDASFAASKPDGDPAMKRLEDMLRGRFGIDHSQTIIVYGREAAAQSGFDLASQLVRLGYRNIIWLREGLVGWAAAGLELSLQPG